jgi:hypothetical protein
VRHKPIVRMLGRRLAGTNRDVCSKFSCTEVLPFALGTGLADFRPCGLAEAQPAYIFGVIRLELFNGTFLWRFHTEMIAANPLH